MQEFFTLRGASENYFGGTVGVETIRDWCHSGRLAFVRPGRMVLIRRRDLDDLVSKSADARLTVPWLDAKRGKQRKCETVPA
jgi:excisionase family DNA binding protein